MVVYRRQCGFSKIQHGLIAAHSALSKQSWACGFITLERLELTLQYIAWEEFVVSNYKALFFETLWKLGVVRQEHWSLCLTISFCSWSLLWVRFWCSLAQLSRLANFEVPSCRRKQKKKKTTKRQTRKWGHVFRISVNEWRHHGWTFFNKHIAMKLDYDNNFLTFFLVLCLSMQIMHYLVKKALICINLQNRNLNKSSFSVSCFWNIHVNSVLISTSTLLTPLKTSYHVIRN